MKIRRSRAGLLGAMCCLALVASACGGDGTSASSGGGDGEEIELTMWTFGEMGFDDLIEQYEEENPGITIAKPKVTGDINEHHDALTTALAGGDVPDIAAVEVGFISKMKANAEQFTNLFDYGAEELEDDYLDWRWEHGLTGDGETLIGLPTDVGGMAMAYRHDLFEAAGLPTDRDEVGELWPTWDDYIDVGKQYTEETGDAFVDESSQVYNAVVNQGEKKYYERDDTLIYDDSQQVQEAWDVATTAIEEGIVADIEPFSAEWNAAMSNGDFATLTAPAWMMGYIQTQAPDTEGNWDIAPLPGGGGNWGGSQLTIPARADHPEEAYEFIKWLLAPEQQLAVFTNTGNFPSTPELYDGDEIQDFSNEFFNDAPVGAIYADNAEQVEPIYEGPAEGPIRLAIENALDRVEQGKESPEEAWKSAVEEIELEVE